MISSGIECVAGWEIEGNNCQFKNRASFVFVQVGLKLHVKINEEGFYSLKFGPRGCHGKAGHVL